MAIGSLGELSFVCSRDKVLTFNNFTRTRAARWERHEVIGRKPLVEYVGQDLATVVLNVRLDMALGVSPEDLLDRFGRMLENKLYKTLVIGDEYIGKFVLESVEEERKYFDGLGNCIAADVTLNLLEWAGE